MVTNVWDKQNLIILEVSMDVSLLKFNIIGGLFQEWAHQSSL